MVRRASARSYAAVVEDTTADEAALADFLDTLKFDANGLLVASAQDVDTGAILMQVVMRRRIPLPPFVVCAASPTQSHLRLACRKHAQAVERSGVLSRAHGVNCRLSPTARRWRTRCAAARQLSTAALAAPCGPRARRPTTSFRCAHSLPPSFCAGCLPPGVCHRHRHLTSRPRCCGVGPQVYSVHVDCDRDSLIYLGAPLGPACHTVRFPPTAALAFLTHQTKRALARAMLTADVRYHAVAAQGADTCFYQRVDGSDGLAEGGEGLGPQAALSTLFQLEATIEERRTAPIADGECLLPLITVALHPSGRTCAP